LSAVKHKKPISAKQYAADVANLKKARAKLKGKPRTAKQIAASRRNLAIARADQKARAAGKTPVTKKAAQAPLPGTGWLHQLPACGPVAVAEHLMAFTGMVVPDEAVAGLYHRLGAVCLAELLEYLKAEGFPGTGARLAYYEQCDTGSGAPGLIVGTRLGRGYHAVLACPDGMAASWGMLLPRAGTPEEAWWLEWEDG
jgi:hypothetical protein